MTSPEVTLRAPLSIGEVLAQLRADFPDTTISKLRFLEAEGLVEPERTPAGYRKYSAHDVARLRYILTAQRDHYLPLRVIREHLDAIDQGIHQAQRPTAVTKSTAVRPLASTDGLPATTDFATAAATITLTHAELIAQAAITEDQLSHVEQYGLIGRSASDRYDEDALAIAYTVAQLAQFGVEPRHLRGYRAAADREIGLFAQVLAPLARQRSAEAKTKAQETARELATLSVRLHAALVQAGLRQLFDE